MNVMTHSTAHIPESNTAYCNHSQSQSGNNDIDVTEISDYESMLTNLGITLSGAGTGVVDVVDASSVDGSIGSSVVVAS